MRAPLVVMVGSGRWLLWVENGRLWMADCVLPWHHPDGPKWSPWREITVAPDIGGQVLAQAEVAQLVPPSIPKETT